jgi:iron complex transport system ATP-binding protein
MKLELRDLSCGYDRHKPVITNVNIMLSSGDVCCILGPNGVGKTTLFKTVLNLLPTLSGQVCIDGENTDGWKPKKLSRYMAFVAQAHIPAFPYRVREVVMMGRMGQIGATGQPSGRIMKSVSRRWRTSVSAICATGCIRTSPAESGSS